MEYDRDFQQTTARNFEKLGFPPDRLVPRFPRGDISSRRQAEAVIPAILSLDTEQHAGVQKTEYVIPGYEGAEISVLAYRKDNTRQTTQAGPAVLYFHGGGMILGSPGLFERMTEADVARTGVAHFSVAYRLAPENRHPIPVEDCYAALVWLSTNAHELGIDPARIGIAGYSAGGGLAAGVTLLSRDRNLQPPVKMQFVCSAMLDDRNTVTDPELLPLVTWDWDDNWTGWNALLGPDIGGSQVSPYAAPARAENLQGLPSTYVEVGSMDIFAEEDRKYAERLAAAGVKVEWHLYDNVPHAFELRGIGSKVYRKALANRDKAIQSL